MPKVETSYIVEKRQNCETCQNLLKLPKPYEMQKPFDIVLEPTKKRLLNVIKKKILKYETPTSLPHYPFTQSPVRVIRSGIPTIKEKK
jgi:hypothetical protein